MQEKVAPRSTMVTGELSGGYAGVALVAGELGQLAAAERYKAESIRHYVAWKKAFPAGSYEAEQWTKASPVFEVEFALAIGDLARAREEAKGAREGLLQLKPGDDPNHQRTLAFFLRRLHSALGRVELEANDFAAAEKQYRLVAEARRSQPAKTITQRRADAEDTARWALALARSGRLDEARPKAAQALAFERELHASKPDDQLHKWNLTVALVASAYANPQQASALLAEAQAVFDSLPADARALRTGRWIGGLVSDARRTLR
jgi:tetratricopeptide (TPR) repeat protein